MRRKPQRFLVVPLKRNLNNMSNVDIRDNIFYAVGTGPARSEFLTLQAVRVLEKCSTIFYPVTGKDEKSHIAFDCVCGAIDVSKKKCVGVEFSMTRDLDKTAAEYESFVSQVEDALLYGDVAMVAIGDVSVYSTAARLAHLVAGHGHKIRFVAGVTSFCTAACECSLDLAERDNEIRIIPGDAFFVGGKISCVLDDSATKIFIKSPRHLKDIIVLAAEKHLLEKTYLVQGAGSDNQKIFSGSELACLDESVFKNSYMSVLIVQG